MTLASAAGFVEALRSLPLLTAAQQVQLTGLQQQFPDLKALARELIRRVWLTVFQANQLARGKGHELVLDQYVLLELLGRGGMGAVYRAKQTRMDRVVALKIIRPDALKTAGAVERFQREARMAAKLAHANVVTVFDSGAAGNTHYLVMEYIEGADLARLIKEKGALPVAEACGYVRQAALGLQHACEQGLVHRDIKPANLMLTKAGIIKVMDLGLARTVSSADAAAMEGLTGIGVMMGTADYLAPEQALNARMADIRADIYSLGCTLYQLLAGRVPFPGGTFAEKLLANQLQEPEPVERLRPDAPEGLGKVVQTMMAKKPEQRYQSPAEVARVLDRFASGPGPVSRPVPAGAGVATAETVGLCGDTGPAYAATESGTAERPPHERKNASLLRERVGALARSRGVQLGVLGCLGLLLVVGAVIRVVVGSAAQSGLAKVADSRPLSARPSLSVRDTALDVTGARPVLLDCTGTAGVSAADVQKAQAAWARYLGRQAEEMDEVAPGVMITFVLVPPGKFVMGSPQGEAYRLPDEVQHEVTITQPFYLGKYEVTQAPYGAAVGKDKNQSPFKGADQPVAGVSWDEAAGYADNLTKNRRDGLVYRLPTEAEWEYACRGGRPSSQPFGIGDGTSLSSDQANFNGNSPYPYGGVKGKYLEKTSPVGSYAPNAFDLHDMHGNVWEWCADWYAPYPAGPVANPSGPPEGHSRVIRGGGWNYNAGACRAASRSQAVPELWVHELGFRLARSSPSGGNK